MRSISAFDCGASMKTASAPRSRAAWPRRMASSSPRRARASVRDEKEIVVVGARAHRAQLAQPLVALDHLLAAHVAAALRKHLILEEQTGRARAMIELDRTQHVERVAVDSVDVDQHRTGGQSADAACRLGHIGLREIAEVGLAEQRRGDAETSDEQGFEPGLFCQPGAEAVVDPAENERAVLGDEIAHALCG
jgi:hypothetical protein